MEENARENKLNKILKVLFKHHLKFRKEDMKRIGFLLFMEKVLLVFWMHKSLDGIWQIGHLRALLISYDIESPFEEITFVKLIEANKKEPECYEKGGEVVPLIFPGSEPACMLQDGAILPGGCHDDSSDDEPERKDGKDIEAEAATYTVSFGCYYNKLDDTDLICNRYERSIT